MSMRRVQLALEAGTVGGVLFTEDSLEAPRHWLLLATVPPDVVLDLRVGGRVELLLDHDGGERRVVGTVDEVSVDAAEGRVQLQGHHGLDPWPRP
jgi:hypothetical protein